MIRTITVLFLILTANISIAQSSFFAMGQNYSTFDFKDSEGNTDFEFGRFSGQYYEVGGIFSLERLSSGLSFSSSITLNQFNSIAGNLASFYQWEANYLGINNVFKYNFLENSEAIDFKLKVGIGISTIINGNQTKNGAIYNLLDDREFNGFWYSPSAGSELIFFPTSRFGVGLGYNYSKTFSGNVNTQVLKFSNHQLQFILQVKRF